MGTQSPPASLLGQQGLRGPNKSQKQQRPREAAPCSTEERLSNREKNNVHDCGKTSQQEKLCINPDLPLFALWLLLSEPQFPHL